MSSIFGSSQLKILLNKSYFSFLVALITLILLPIRVYILPPFMALWCVVCFFENYSLFVTKWKWRNEYSLLFILFLTYYLWQAAGLIYTTDLKMGFLNLFSRFSLILYPLVLIFPGEMIRKRIKLLLRTFVIGTSLFLLICYFYALSRSLDMTAGSLSFNPHPADFPWLNYFYSSLLTLDQHPSYIAMYAILSLFICFESSFDTSLKFKYRIIWLLVGFFLLISQYFLSSRAGLLTCLLLVPAYFILKFRQLSKGKYAWVVIILLLAAILPVVLKNQRVDYLYGRISGNQTGYVRKEDPRLIIWQSAFNVAKKKILLGVGIGDVRDELVLEYKNIGEEKMAAEKFNAHNQFLETLVENGIIGLILFGSIFIKMLQIAFSEKNLLYLMFILLTFIFFIFETVLYRLAGVTFFSIFSVLLVYYRKE
jgi:O-antigen ligase